jgi:hypothetical protein
MKSYFAATAVAALACVYVVAAAEVPLPAANAAPARSAEWPTAARGTAWPAAAPAMARRPESRWLLRAMSAAGCTGTLASSPCELPTEPHSL